MAGASHRLKVTLKSTEADSLPYQLYRNRRQFFDLGQEDHRARLSNTLRKGQEPTRTEELKNYGQKSVADLRAGHMHARPVHIERSDSGRNHRENIRNRCRVTVPHRGAQVAIDPNQTTLDRANFV